MKKFKLVIQSLPSTGKTTTMRRLQEEGFFCVDSDYIEGKGSERWGFGMVHSLLTTGADILFTNLWMVGYADLLLEEGGKYITLMPSDLKQYLINSRKDGHAGDNFDEFSVVDWFHSYATSTNVRIMEGNHISIPSGLTSIEEIVKSLEKLTIFAHDNPSLEREAVNVITQMGVEDGVNEMFPYKGNNEPPKGSNEEEVTEEGKTGEL